MSGLKRRLCIIKMADKEKAYVAAKFERKEDVKKIYEILRSRGYDISCDWTDHISIPDFRQNIPLGQQYAEEDINGVLNANIFIMLPLGTTVGANNELATAILGKRLFGKPSHIYIIEEEGARFGPFYVQKEITLKKNLEEVLKDLGICK